MKHDLQAMLDDFQRDLERVSEIASIRFNMAVRAQLDEWRARFPRHAFKAWEGHGMLAIDVHPPVCGETRLDYLDEERGAIGEAGREALALINAYNASELKACFLADDQTSEGWQETRLKRK
jgi:hypothetical protein